MGTCHSFKIIHSPFRRVIHPSKRVIQVCSKYFKALYLYFIKGERKKVISSLKSYIHPSKRVIHSSGRVNGRMNRMVHPSNGEWGRWVRRGSFKYLAK